MSKGWKHCAEFSSGQESGPSTGLEACGLEINIIKLSCQPAFGSAEGAAIHKSLAVFHASVVFPAFPPV